MKDTELQELLKSQSELKRYVSLLSYVGMGFNEEMDAALTSLRQAIKEKQNDDSLKKKIARISKLLMNQEEAQSGIEVSLLEILNKTSLTNDLQRELELAQKSASKKWVKLAVASLDILFEEVNKKQKNKAETSEQDEEKTATHKPGLIGKMLKSRRSNKKLSKGQESTFEAAENLPIKVRESMQQLVDQLAAMENYTQVAVKLNEKVANLSSLDQLIDMLELLTGAFVEISTNEHQQLEGFLKSLGKRIDHVKGFVDETMVFSQQVTESTNSLDKKLKGSVSDIQSNVEKSTSLSDVKIQIQDKMASIVGAVNQFQEQQQSHQKLLNRNIENLQEQLLATHDESSRLKDELAAQRIRAQTDPLTNLPNRYSYNERLTQEYNRWRRYRSPLTLVVGDMDHFKLVNDNYGHAAGDTVIKDVAHFLQASIRESDFAARFGGEEFVFLLPETSLLDATKAMNKIRLGVKDLKMSADEKDISIAMSFGIAEFENNDTPKAVFARADQALYRAKEKGRDQVCCQRANATDE